MVNSTSAREFYFIFFNLAVDYTYTQVNFSYFSIYSGNFLVHLFTNQLVPRGLSYQVPSSRYSSALPQEGEEEQQLELPTGTRAWLRSQGLCHCTAMGAVSTHRALLQGTAAPPARCKSMGHSAGKATASCPLLHALHPLPSLPREEGTVPAAGQTATEPWQSPSSSSSMLLCLPQPCTSSPSSCTEGSNQKFCARGWVVYPSHSLQQEGEKKSLIQDTKKIGIIQLCSVNETCILKRWRTQPIITWGSAWPFNWFTDPPSANAGVHLVKRMYEINNQGKAKIKMKNEENINNKNFQAQKILGKAVT